MTKLELTEDQANDLFDAVSEAIGWGICELKRTGLHNTHRYNNQTAAQIDRWRDLLKVLPKTRAPSRQDVRDWMALNSEGYHSATALAEAAPVPAVWLDDETHWIWEEALEAVGFNDPEITSEAG